MSTDRLPQFSPRQNIGAVLPAVVMPQSPWGGGAVVPQQFQQMQAQQMAMMWLQQRQQLWNQPFGMPFQQGPFQLGFGGAPMYGSPPLMYVVPMRVNPMDPANYLFGRY